MATDFLLEKDMKPIVKKWLTERFQIIREEFRCGYVGKYVPDLVAINFNLAELGTRRRNTPMPRRRIEKQISLGKTPKVYHTNLVAVELKLKNFPQAYFQAKIYNSYGMRTYIAMPIKVAINIDRIRREVLQNDGIGLIGVSDKCKVFEEATKPSVYKLLEEIQIAERLIPKR